MESVVCIVAAALAYVVFRVYVWREYQQIGRLTWQASLLELLVFGLFMSFPYLYNPPEWISFWLPEVPVSEPLRLIGVVSIGIGLVSTFGTMFWFGLRRAFGVKVEGLVQTGPGSVGGGPYRVTRNPQIVGGSLLVLGSALLWPSWCALVWVVLYGVVGHWMVMTEEEHLLEVFGEEYARYCQRVLGLWWRRQKAGT